jgi:ABC-type transporter Mla maintaining outer membrane lipid asymmetry ATPase subunit MlaF
VTAASETAVLELSAVSKQYGALRPLRLERLSVAPGDRIALIGLDQPAAEVFINLVTGASLPDTGVIRVFGRATAEIADSADWLSTLDRFGIVSDRAALLDPLSVVQNLAVPFSLEIEPPPPDIREQAVRLAREAGLGDAAWDRPVSELDASGRVRVRLARALAFDPAILLLEHASATVARPQIQALADDIRAIVERRGGAAIALTMDREFADAVSAKTLTLDPATGRITERPSGKIRFWR